MQNIGSNLIPIYERTFRLSWYTAHGRETRRTRLALMFVSPSTLPAASSYHLSEIYKNMSLIKKTGSLHSISQCEGDCGPHARDVWLSSLERYVDLEMGCEFLCMELILSAMVLFRRDDLAQVIVHTANMIEKDWR
jgi:Tyrosyl-DNA phosphodiesterase